MTGVLLILVLGVVVAVAANLLILKLGYRIALPILIGIELIIFALVYFTAT